MSVTPTPTPAPESLWGLLDLRLIVLILVVAAAAIAIERIINTYLSRFAKRAKLEPHTTNNLMITTRILILLGAIAAIADVGGLPPEWILSVSAVSGAALGFASQKTIGNFIAGLFLLSAHPFRVGDYVSVSNLQILDRDITNFAYEIEKVGRSPGMYCYTFEVGFDHNVSAQKISEVFEAVFKNHLLELPKKPAYTLIRSGGTERVYMVYLYVRKPEDIFKFRSQIAEEVFSLWDQERTKPKA